MRKSLSENRGMLGISCEGRQSAANQLRVGPKQAQKEQALNNESRLSDKGW